VFTAFFCLWLIFDHASFDWHAVATCATLAITLFIKRAEHRDTQAIQAKPDELLRAHDKAKTDFAQIDREQPRGLSKSTERQGTESGACLDRPIP
jgi:low affinity Fe/Cu permease